MKKIFCDKCGDEIKVEVEYIYGRELCPKCVKALIKWLETHDDEDCADRSNGATKREIELATQLNDAKIYIAQLKAELGYTMTKEEIELDDKHAQNEAMWHDVESNYTICVEVKRDDIDNFLKEVEKRRPEIIYRDIGECTIKASPTQLAMIPETLTHDKTYFYFTGDEIIPFFELKNEILCKAKLYKYYKEDKE